MQNRILLIDDEEGLRFTFEMLLNRAGYGNVQAAANLEEALGVLKEKPESFDLVISDIVLDGASGIDILRHVKQSGQQCPVVMITGYPSIETAAEAVRLGAFDYIPKPVKKQALLEVVERALAHRTICLAAEEKRKQEEKVRARQESIWQSLPELVITVDHQQQIIAMNDVAHHWCRDCLPDLTVGSRIERLPEPLAGNILHGCAAVRETGEPVHNWMVSWIRPDQTTGTLQMAAAPLAMAGTSKAGVVLTARDISHLADGASRKTNRLHRLVGSSLVMQQLFETIRNVGSVDATVLITGESGTGKELVADALHLESKRKNGMLIKVDCTAIPDNLLESELFGHCRGAFTGAVQDRQGRLLQADGGTLFLDEIGDISPRMQLRLLHFLQEQNFYPVGRDQPVSVDVRIIAATNADLRKKVEQGLFREDLYFRLRVVDVEVPPLRARDDDVIFLADHFLQEYGRLFKKQFGGFSEQALEKLSQHRWPGNVRELKHVVERAAVLCQGGVVVCDLLQLAGDPEEAPAPAAVSRTAESIDDQTAAERQPEESERILSALQHAGGNKAKAARLLGIDRSTLYRKMAACNLDGEMS